MDTLAHALWGVTIVRKRRLFWWLVLFGLLPDLLTSVYGLLTFGPEPVLIFGNFKTGILLPPFYNVYFFTHSFLTAFLIYLILYFFKRKYVILVVPYFLHVLFDIPCHCSEFSTRFFYPLSDFHICGLSYVDDPRLKVINYLALILVNPLIFKFESLKKAREERRTWKDDEQTRKKDENIGLVLGAGIDKKGKIPPHAVDRVREAVTDFKKGKISKIIFSGKWSRNAQYTPPYTESEAGFKIAVKLGVDPKYLYLEKKGMTTAHNFYYAKKDLLEPKDWRVVLIYTSDFQARRANLLARKIFGQEYSIKIAALQTRLSEDKAFMIAQDQDYQITKKLLSQVKNGNEDKVLKIMAGNEYDKACQQIYGEKRGIIARGRTS